MKLSEVKAGMWVSLECSHSPSKYVQNLHGCRGQVEDIHRGKVQVRVTDRQLNVLLVSFSPENLKRRIV